MNKKLISILFILILLTTMLCSCQLAKKDAGEITQAKLKDDFIGFYITTDYIDFGDNEDIEKYLFAGSKNINDLINESLKEKWSDISESHKIYADITKTNEEKKYSFGSIEGISFFNVTDQEDECNQRHTLRRQNPHLTLLPSCVDATERRPRRAGLVSRTARRAFVAQCSCETWKQATSYCETACALPFASDGVPGLPA
jgi:disulfide oxidoreductase YuzD